MSNSNNVSSMRALVMLVALIMVSIAVAQMTPPKPCARSSDCGSSTQYCRQPVGVCDSGSGSLGSCEPIPTICTKEYSPTCGCDYVTYSNPCHAAANGTSVLYRGPCDAVRTCNSSSTCAKGQYCRYLVGTCGGTGQCDGAPQICPLIYAPVCGCDGNTYGNECEAQSNKVSVQAYGACPTKCKSNNDCTEADSFCDTPKCVAPGTCVVAPQFCPLIYSPVCGCDNRTYSNSCYAQAAYMSVMYRGACE